MSSSWVTVSHRAGKLVSSRGLLTDGQWTVEAADSKDRGHKAAVFCDQVNDNHHQGSVIWLRIGAKD